MKPAIRISNLTKHYSLGGAAGEYRTLRESLAEGLLAPWRRLRRGAATGDRQRFYALRDISFDVQPGDVVGLIGRNGAGKSTLLKILSRITEPTTGRVEMRGRIASLLEVGTGFHPELTGRENIYLNGAILGMTRQEIVRKFDEIVAFSEIERFLDTPVKRYSSGMYVRLAFAVAAHLEPELLIIDEVLAVGDAAFQKKCLGKMNEVSKAGRTILFVSHNMAAVKSLCNRGALLDGGRLVAEGGIAEVVDRYLLGSTSSNAGVIADSAPRIGTGEVKVRAVRLTNLEGQEVTELYLGQPFRACFLCEALKEVSDVQFEVSVSALDGTHIACALTTDDGRPPRPLTKGWHTIEVEFDVVLLPRLYSLDVGVHHQSGFTIDLVQRAFDFGVLKVAVDPAASYRWSHVRGYVRPRGRWRVSQGDESFHSGRGSDLPAVSKHTLQDTRA